MNFACACVSIKNICLLELATKLPPVSISLTYHEYVPSANGEVNVIVESVTGILSLYKVLLIHTWENLSHPSIQLNPSMKRQENG